MLFLWKYVKIQYSSTKTAATATSTLISSAAATHSSFLYLRAVSESGISEKSDFVKPEMKETLGCPFQKER